MGAANVIPGVSGGTIAFITGIYQKLIDCLKSFDRQALTFLFQGKFQSLAIHLNLRFLLPILLGVLASFASLARLLKHAYATHPILVNAFFFGLIAASIFSVFTLVKRWKFIEIFSLILGLILALSLAFGMQPSEENRSFIYLLFCGVAGMCSMIIPGISGSFILLLMGNYSLVMLEGLSLFFSPQWLSALPILLPVGLGACLGLIVLSHLLSWLFTHYHNATTALITGFITGSLAIIWPWKQAIPHPSFSEKTIGWMLYCPSWSAQTALAFGLFILGIGLIFLLEKLLCKA